MIHIQTYIMHDDMFIPIADFHGMIKDRNYVPGSIELQVDGKVIIDRNVWDYISDLWPYLLHGIEALLDGQPEWETYYPDQPISLAFKVIANNRVAITIDYSEKTSAAARMNSWIPCFPLQTFFSPTCCVLIQILHWTIRAPWGS